MVRLRSAVVVVGASAALVTAASAVDADAHHRHLQVVSFRQDILDAVNAERQSRKLPKYCMVDQLMYAAQVHANDMAEHNFTSSTGSDKSNPTERAASQGFLAPLVTETVGAGFASASSIVAAWAKIVTAESTMLNGSYNVLGPGYAYDRTKRWVHFWAVSYSTGKCGDDKKAAAPATPTGGASGEPPADEGKEKKEEGDKKKEEGDKKKEEGDKKKKEEGDEKKEGDEPAAPAPGPETPETPDATPAPKHPGAPAPKTPGAPAPEAPAPEAPAPEARGAAPAPEAPAPEAPAPEARGAAPAPKTPDAPGGVHAAPNAGPGGAPNAAPRPGPGTPITFDT